MAFTFTINGAPECDTSEDAINGGLNVSLFEGTCASIPAGGLNLKLSPFVAHTVNHRNYGTILQTFGPETVSARLGALLSPPGACGEWTMNLEITGANSTALNLGGANPFALVLSDSDGDRAGCFDINNAIVGNQIVAPPHGARRGGRR
jgi:hypothetical protein